MPTTTEVQAQVSLDELLDNAARLEIPELERFISQILILRAQRIAPGLSKKEADLLERINQHLPANIQQRYDELTAKRQEETLTPSEHQELLTLLDDIEQRDAERAQALVDLAQLRQISVSSLMDELGIRPPDYA
jgi:hypothetical protein